MRDGFDSPVLEFDGLEVSFGGVLAVRGASFKVMPGECVGIVGESGSGKSTLVKAAMGLLGPRGAVSSGRVLFEGRDVASLSREEMRRLRGPGMGLVPQDASASFVPVRTFGAQAFEAVRAHGKAQRADVERELCALLAELNVEDPERILASCPFELSGGLGQRAAIALAMRLRPKVLFADEPTSALDAVSQKQTVDALSRLKEETGSALVVITHNIGVVKGLADRVLVMDGGRIVEEGPAEEVFSRPKHPKTKALLDAVPKLGGERRSLRDGCGDVVLEGRLLEKAFRGRDGGRIEAAKGVSFSLRRGECLGIVGASGSGKSTLANMVMRFEEPDGGEILLEGADIARAKGRKLRDSYRSVQMVFQNPVGSFDPRRTLEHSVAEPLRNAGFGRSEARARARELMGRCGLAEELCSRYPNEVSGGQCQRAAISRALAVEPSVLVCDEATSALDVTAQSKIVSLLEELRAETGMAVLFICHDIALVAAACERVIVMDGGEVVEEGPVGQVLSNPCSESTKALVEAVL